MVGVALSVTHHCYAEGVSAISRRSSAANTAGTEQQKAVSTPKGSQRLHVDRFDPLSGSVTDLSREPVVFATLKPPANGLSTFGVEVLVGNRQSVNPWWPATRRSDSPTNSRQDRKRSSLIWHIRRVYKNSPTRIERVFPDSAK